MGVCVKESYRMLCVLTSLFSLPSSLLHLTTHPHPVLQKLENLLLWMKSQTHYHFYCSSLLIVYDGYQGSEYHKKHITRDQQQRNGKHFLQHLASQFPDPHPLPPEDSNDIDDAPDGPADGIGGGGAGGGGSNADEELRESEYLSLPIVDTALDAATATVQHKRRRPAAPLEKQIQVKMIDFAHALPGTGHIDNGYMTGLHSLISRLHRVAHAHDELPAYMLSPQ